jgi:hypothetical protein
MLASISDGRPRAGVYACADVDTNRCLVGIGILLAVECPDVTAALLVRVIDNPSLA